MIRKNNLILFGISLVLILFVSVVTAIADPSAVYCEEQGGTSIIADCRAVGTRSEGWYNHLTNELIMWSQCNEEGLQKGFCLIDGEYIDAWEFYNPVTEEIVCCKIYGLGVYMKEVNIHYEWTKTSACKVPEDFVGGGREIVDDSYCEAITCEDYGYHTTALPDDPRYWDWEQVTVDGLTCWERSGKCIFSISDYCIKLWMILTIIGGIILLNILKK